METKKFIIAWINQINNDILISNNIIISCSKEKAVLDFYGVDDINNIAKSNKIILNVIEL